MCSGLFITSGKAVPHKMTFADCKKYTLCLQGTVIMPSVIHILSYKDLCLSTIKIYLPHPNMTSVSAHGSTNIKSKLRSKTPLSQKPKSSNPGMCETLGTFHTRAKLFGPEFLWDNQQAIGFLITMWNKHRVAAGDILTSQNVRWKGKGAIGSKTFEDPAGKIIIGFKSEADVVCSSLSLGGL